jgi:uncharacterized protein (DUF952 family)
MKKLLLCLLLLTACDNTNGRNMPPKNQENSSPEYLYKIVTPEQWQQSQTSREVVKGSIDTNFIHLSTQEQLSGRIQKFWKNQNYIVLKLDRKKLKGHLVLEANPGGTNLYYHLYDGKIPLDAVASSTPFYTPNR